MSRIIKPGESTNPNKAPIIITDSNELGDKRLDPKEVLIKLREENNSHAQRMTRKPDQDILGNKDMAQGQPMEYQHLIHLLKKMNPNIIIKDGGVKGAVQVRYHSTTDWDQKSEGGDGTKYVTGFYKEVLPEFSWEQDDSRGRPTREIRGWRTVVLALIKQGIISYKDAVDVFGEPNGIRSGRWKKLLREYRA